MADEEPREGAEKEQCNGNWIKLHRRFTEWGWYSDPNTKIVFLELLLRANWKAGEYLGHKIERGQAVIGRQEMAETLYISPQSVRTALKHLKSTNEIAIKTTNKFSIVTILNYNKYQSSETQVSHQINQLTNQQSTNNQPTTNHIQEYKKERKKEYKKGRSLLLAEFLEKIEHQEIRNLLTYWTKWRAEQRGKPCTPKAVELILKTYKDKPADLRRDMEHSIKHDYIGIFPAAPQRQFQAKPKQPEPVQPPGVRDALAARFLNRKIN